jgi:hypothetical protein
MSRVVWAVIGSMAGYAASVPSSPYWHQDVQIYGGSMTSTPVADVWGYDNDWAACLVLAAGANFLYDKPESARSALVEKWANDGNTRCHRKR